MCLCVPMAPMLLQCCSMALSAAGRFCDRFVVVLGYRCILSRCFVVRCWLPQTKRPDMLPGRELLATASCPSQLFSSRASLVFFKRVSVCLSVFKRVRQYKLPGRSCQVSLVCFALGDEGTRTPDFLLAKQALSQLSYIPASRLHASCRSDGSTRLELVTSRLSGECSNQLSY